MLPVLEILQNIGIRPSSHTCPTVLRRSNSVAFCKPPVGHQLTPKLVYGSNCFTKEVECTSPRRTALVYLTGRIRGMKASQY